MTVYVTPDQLRRLRKLHARTQVPIAVYVRQGIESMLKKAGV